MKRCSGTGSPRGPRGSRNSSMLGLEPVGIRRPRFTGSVPGMTRGSKRLTASVSSALTSRHIERSRDAPAEVANAVAEDRGRPTSGNPRDPPVEPRLVLSSQRTSRETRRRDSADGEIDPRRARLSRFFSGSSSVGRSSRQGWMRSVWPGSGMNAGRFTSPARSPRCATFEERDFRPDPW